MSTRTLVEIWLRTSHFTTHWRKKKNQKKMNENENLFAIFTQRYRLRIPACLYTQETFKLKTLTWMAQCCDRLFNLFRKVFYNARFCCLSYQCHIFGKPCSNLKFLTNIIWSVSIFEMLSEIGFTLITKPSPFTVYNHFNINYIVSYQVN